jgi:hypothetical protein
MDLDRLDDRDHDLAGSSALGRTLLVMDRERKGRRPGSGQDCVYLALNPHRGRYDP